MEITNGSNKKQPVANSQNTKTYRGMCVTAALCVLFGGVMGLALMVLSWVAVIIVCISIFAMILGALAVCKTPSIRGKIGTLLSIVVLLVCSFSAIVSLMSSKQAELHEKLLWAAVNGNKDRVRSLVNEGADINKIHENSYTLLHSAIRRDNSRMVEALLAGGADVNIKNSRGLTPMQLLLDRNIDLRRRKKNFDYEAVAGLLLANGATFDFQQKKHGRSNCIQVAISNNQNKMLRLMLENGADINLKEENGGYLHCAIRERAKIDIIETLLSAGVDLRIRDKDGNTALHTAAYFGRGDIVKALLNKGADINSKNNKQMTALDVAKHRRGNFLGNRQKVIELLKEKEKSSKQSELGQEDSK